MSEFLVKVADIGKPYRRVRLAKRFFPKKETRKLQFRAAWRKLLVVCWKGCADSAASSGTKWHHLMALRDYPFPKVVDFDQKFPIRS